MCEDEFPEVHCRAQIGAPTTETRVAQCGIVVQGACSKEASTRQVTGAGSNDGDLHINQKLKSAPSYQPTAALVTTGSHKCILRDLILLKWLFQ